MKYLLSYIFLFVWLGISLFGQKTADFTQGNISYITSQNVYVQFVNTEGIQIGDTLYTLKNNTHQSALVVKNLSSISCICNPVNGYLASVSNQVIAKKKVESAPIEVLTQQSKEAVSVNDAAVLAVTKKVIDNKQTGKFDGRISLSSYLNNTSDTTMNSIFRLNLSLNAAHISNSKFSAECYMSVTKKSIYRPITSTIDSTTTQNYLIDEPLDVKIYNLAVKYDLPDSMYLTFGRKINPNLANIGAVDGFQFEKFGKQISYGAVIGSRPDTYTYSLNPGLLQYGAYVGHQLKTKNGFMQTSVALFNQTNNMQTDRRFAYIQHSNSLLKQLDFFGSAEIDLYALQNNQPVTTFNLTSVYAMLQWRVLKNLSLSMSYDARKNIYYYETYKNYIDSVLDKETRQGLRFQAMYRPLKFLTWGGNAGIRFATPTSNASTNGYTYLTMSQLPFETTLTVDVTALKTNYLSGMIYGASLSKELFDGNLFTQLTYRNVNYTTLTSLEIPQNIGELSLSWRITKKLLLSADFEATFNADKNFQGRAFINLSQRF
ncbi:MAG: hypothetical protein WCL70_06360 [Paludibacter sp.]